MGYPCRTLAGGTIGAAGGPLASGSLLIDICRDKDLVVGQGLAGRAASK